MTVLDIICRMPENALVTVVDTNDQILIDCDLCDRINAFKDIDSEVRRIVNGVVIGIKAGEVWNDIILTAVME